MENETKTYLQYGGQKRYHWANKPGNNLVRVLRIKRSTCFIEKKITKNGVSWYILPKKFLTFFKNIKIIIPCKTNWTARDRTRKKGKDTILFKGGQVT